MPECEWKLFQKYVKLQKHIQSSKTNSDTVDTKVFSALTHDGNFLKMLLQCSRKEIVLPQLQAATYSSVKVPASRPVVPEDGLNPLADCTFP